MFFCISKLFVGLNGIEFCLGPFETFVLMNCFFICIFINVVPASSFKKKECFAVTELRRDCFVFF